MIPPRRARLRAAFYARVSSERQLDAETIASQIDLLRRRIQADGLALDEGAGFVDDGYSGETLRRPALERLRDAGAAGAFDRLYVEGPDRLARDYAYQIVLVDEFRRAGIEVVFLNHGLDAGPEGRPLLQVQSIIAEYERVKIKERTRRGRLYAARCGRVSALGRAPYGYRYKSRRDYGEAQYVVDLAEARVVRAIFTWVGLEGCSLSQVRRRLREQGVVTRRGRAEWDRSTLLGMLTNPAYTGTAQFGKQRSGPPRPRVRPRRGQSEFPRRSYSRQPTRPEERIAIAVPALIAEELFAAVQEHLAGHRAHPGRAARGGGALLRGLVVCRRCGYAYCRKSTGGGRGAAPGPRTAYYRCQGTNRARYHGEQRCRAR